MNSTEAGKRPESVLAEATHAQVTTLSEAGNDAFDKGEYLKAIGIWQQALDRLPAPHSQWNAATWLHASIGDAYWQAGMASQARVALFDSLNCPDGVSNPFIHYRIGQATEKLLGLEAAMSHYLKAYMLDGKDIFFADPAGMVPLSALRRKKLIDD